MASTNQDGKHPSTFEIRINGKKFEYQQPVITGAEVLTLAGLEPPKDYEILKKDGEKLFEPVELEEKVTLDPHGPTVFEANPKKELTIFIDDEPFKVNKCFMTPVEILALDKKSPEQYYLKQILGHKEITYKNDEHHQIAMVDKMRFSTCKKEPATVS